MSEGVLGQSSASGEEVLRQTLPLVVDAVARSAEGHAASAAAMTSLEARVAELRSSVRDNSEVLAKLLAHMEETKAKSQSIFGDVGGIAAAIRPSTVYYTVVLILTALGLRASIPVPTGFDVDQPGAALPAPTEAVE